MVGANNVAVLFAGRNVNAHWKAIVSPSLSLEPAPLRMTVAPVATAWSAPALATGGRLTGGGAAVLFARLGSCWLLFVIVATSVSGPVAFTVAPRVSVASPPGDIEPIVQSPVMLL